MYKHVLVAVDLSDESEFLLKKAVGIAKRNEFSGTCGLSNKRKIER